MEWLHLLMPLVKYKRNITLQGITEYSLLHVHVKKFTETEKKMMNNRRQKQDSKAMDPQKKKIIFEKK